MKKKYEQPEENPEQNTVNEPAIEYHVKPVTEIKGSPPLTEEELKECLTTDEAIEYMHNHIHKLFNKK